MGNDHFQRFEKELLKSRGQLVNLQRRIKAFGRRRALSRQPQIEAATQTGSLS